LRRLLGSFRGGGCGGLSGLDFLFERFEAFELVEGVAVIALGPIDHALEAGEGAVAVGEGVTEGGGIVEFVGGVHLVDEDLGFGGGEAAEGPGGTDEDVDEVALLRDGGVEALEVLLEESVEVGAIFAGDDE
jgi:hypothetical protein